MRFNNFMNETQLFQEGIVNLNRGYRLVCIEDLALCTILFIYNLVKGGKVGDTFFLCLLIFIAIPVLLIFIKPFGYIWAVVASIAWAYIGYVIGYMMCKEDVAGGMLFAVITGVLVFIFHKASLGLNYRTLLSSHFTNQENIMKSVQDAGDKIANSINSVKETSNVTESPVEERAESVYTEPVEQPKIVNPTQRGTATGGLGSANPMNRMKSESGVIYHCGKCGADYTNKSRFCGKCGGMLGTRCASCGADVPKESKFCNNCGKQLS